MLRTFKEHDVRGVDSLDGRWDFITAAERKDHGLLPRRYRRTIQVPSAWENLPGFETYRGQAWLRRTFVARPGFAARLVFGGVSHTATVYVDRRPVGRHYDAFTHWDIVLPNLKPGAHELVVAVDNTFGDHSALHRPNDYYTYGGITRPVEVHSVPPAYLERAWLTPRLQRGGRWALDVRVTLSNWSGEPLRRGVRLTVAGCEVDLGQVTVPAGGRREIRTSLTGLEVKPWSAAGPNLYSARLELLDGECVVDDLADRVGFREVRVRGKKLLLNGKPLRLRGVNRHEDHPQFGNALPIEAIANDLDIIQDLGCNFVRTSHYPNDQRFLDLCDELGIYVWEESHARAVDFTHPKFREQITANTVEMVEWHYNHPSIVMWGCLNECDSATRAGRVEYAHVLKTLKRLDGTRPVTFASNRGSKDRCFDLVDIVSWNRYDAWYGESIADIEPEIKARLKWLHKGGAIRAGGKGKPVIMSEFGGGAIYGYRRPHHARWTEEYQAEVLEESLRVYLNMPDVVGAVIWQFADVRVTEEEWWNKRPRTMNNKGIVDEYRRPKLAYDTVKRRMLEAAQRRES